MMVEMGLSYTDVLDSTPYPKKNNYMIYQGMNLLSCNSTNQLMKKINKSRRNILGEVQQQQYNFKSTEFLPLSLALLLHTAPPKYHLTRAPTATRMPTAARGFTTKPILGCVSSTAKTNKQTNKQTN